MKWRKRQAELDRLRAKHADNPYQVQFPDLSCKPVPACSNRFDVIHEKPKPAQRPPKGAFVDHLHKSSLQVLLRSELPWAGGKKP